MTINNLPEDDDLYRIKNEQESFPDTPLVDFRNDLVRRLNNTPDRYSLRDIANLLVYNSKKILNREYFDVDTVYEIIDELFIKYVKNKEED